MRTYVGENVWCYAFLTSQLDRGDGLVLRPGHSAPCENHPVYSGTHWIGDCVHPKTNLNRLR
jgi:hypothetical protein